MLAAKYVHGETNVRFKCGCKGRIVWIMKEDSVLGIDVKHDYTDFILCEKHSRIDLDTVSWETVVRNIFEEIRQKDSTVTNYEELFDAYDEIKLEEEFDYYKNARV